MKDKKDKPQTVTISASIKAADPKKMTETLREHAEKIIEGIKHDQQKDRYDLIPPRSLEALVGIYTYGSSKYGDRNWEKGMSWGRIFAAIMRHLWAFWKGEDVDPESGMLHTAHAAWGCFALIEYHFSKRDLDDRPRKE